MTREHTALTAAMEKRILLWMARRIPPFINADHLTALAFVSQLLAGLAYAHAALWAVNICLVLNWFGDSLDGTLARVRNQQRPRYGFYVDHMVDSLGAMVIMLGLAASGLADWRIAIAMLIGFLMLSIEAYLATYTLGSFRLSYSKFGPTEIRLLLIAACVRALINPNVRLGGHEYRLFDVGGVIATAGMAAMCIVSAILHTRSLYRQETLR